MMNKKIILLILNFLPFSVFAGANIDFQLQAHKYKTKSQISYVLVENRDLPIISVDIYFKKSGASYDTKNGIANIAAEIIEIGSAVMSEKEFSNFLQENAIKYKVEVDKDYFKIKLKTLSPNLNNSINLLKKVILEPVITEELLNNVKTKIEYKLLSENEDPILLAKNNWYNLAFKNHSYMNNISGDKDSLKSITKSDIEDYFAKLNNKNNMVITVVGDISEQNMSDILDRNFSNISSNKDNRSVNFIHPKNKKDLIYHNVPIPQTTIIFGQKSVSIKDKNFYKAMILNYVLGGNFNSRLFSEIRIKRGLAYRINTNLYNLANSNIILGYVGTKNESVQEVINLIKQEISKIKENGITMEEFENAKSYLINSFPLALDSNDNIAGMFNYIQINDLPLDYLNQRTKSIELTNFDQLNQFAKEFFDHESLIFSGVGGAHRTPDI